MHPSLGPCQRHLSMVVQSPINLCHSLRRLLPRMVLFFPRVSQFMIIRHSSGLFLQWFLEPSSSPVPARASETYSGPSTSRDSDAANGEESYPEDLYAPIIAGRSPPQSFAASSSHVQVPEPSPPPEDYSCPVKGMYRLLDLITELGSSGLGNRPFLGYQFHELIEI